MNGPSITKILDALAQPPWRKRIMQTDASDSDAQLAAADKMLEANARDLQALILEYEFAVRRKRTRI